MSSGESALEGCTAGTSVCATDSLKGSGVLATRAATCAHVKLLCVAAWRSSSYTVDLQNAAWASSRGDDDPPSEANDATCAAKCGMVRGETGIRCAENTYGFTRGAAAEPMIN